MKINPKIFSLPPYISTTWNNVIALYVKEGNLIVSLIDGEIIEIPNLKPELLEIIFNAHNAYMEFEIAREHFSKSNNKSPNPVSLTSDSTGESPFRFAFSTLDGLGYALQHNPSQANAPEIPKEVLEKISAIAKIVAPEEANTLPKAEPHCNCMYCQIARAIQGEQQENVQEVSSEETVSDDELKFQEWNIVQTGDKMYTVTNKLDTLEKYSVFLGEPVGCTCGKSGCEHILAVLKS